MRERALRDAKRRKKREKASKRRFLFFSGGGDGGENGLRRRMALLFFSFFLSFSVFRKKEYFTTEGETRKWETDHSTFFYPLPPASPYPIPHVQ